MEICFGRKQREMRCIVPQLTGLHSCRSISSVGRLWSARSPSTSRFPFRSSSIPLAFAMNSASSAKSVSPVSGSSGVIEDSHPPVSGSSGITIDSRPRVSGSSGVAIDSRPPVSFPLRLPCTLNIRKGDITQWSMANVPAAIVNPANKGMLGGGGADGAIHRAAGPELVRACKRIPEVRPGVRCPTGEARITQGFNLPVSHVIHTVGPIYQNAILSEPYLRSAYSNSLKIAKENNIHFIAFPAISCGAFMYPLEEAARVAISTVAELAEGLKEVHFVILFDEAYDVWTQTASDMLHP